MSTQITSGSFVNVASQPYFLPLQQQIDFFRIVNLSKTASYTSGRITFAEWNKYMANNIAIVDAPTTITGPLNTNAVIRTQLAQNGFTIFNPFSPPSYATVAIASYTPGTTTAWVTSTPHGFQVGDTVRVWGLTATQFNGLSMTVTAVGSTTTFTTLLNSTGGTTSTGSVMKTGNYLIPSKTGTYPDNRVIAAMTNANPMVITTLVQQNYAAGDVVTFDMPSVFGVPQLSNSISGLPVQGTVISANNSVGTQTVTIAINSTSFGVFGGTNGWPASTSYPFTFPYMVPQGEGNINNLSSYGVTPAPLPYGNQDVLSFAKQANGYGGIIIGAGDGTAAASTGGIIGSTTDTWYWEAHTSLQTFP